MNIQLSDHFDTKKLLRFVAPSVGMMVFMSIYGVVDGFFVSNYAGATAFAAINLIMPFLMIFQAVGFMVGTGGTALVSMKFGEGKEKEANEIFSLLIYLVIAIGVVLTVVGEIFLEKVAIKLGADEGMLPFCISYGRIIMVSLVPAMLQNMFQSFLVTAEKPKMGLWLTVMAGVANMFLDWLFVGVFPFGVTGAAVATAISQAIGGLIPLIYFIFPNSSRLRLGNAVMSGTYIWKACSNGASEFMSNISMSIVNMLYNKQLLKYAGQNGVAAYGVLMYVNFIFIAAFIGYSVGTAPLIGYNYGSENHAELKGLLKKSLRIIGITGIVMVVLAFVLATPLSRLYVGYDAELMNITVDAFKIYAFTFLLAGFNIYGSSFFTALNNGAISAGISFMRTLVFQIISVLVLPIFFGLKGIWYAVIVAEILSLTLTVYFWIKERNRYHYA